MADVLLTCAETPLAWPVSVDLTDVRVSTTSTMNLFSSAAGPLQVLTRRQGGAGDGVNIVESPTVGADYRGQRYSLEEVVFHTPGLHIFPGQSAVYPAELHVHMKTFAAPTRALTVVIPVSHLTPPNSAQQAYFAAAAAQPDASTPPPQLTTLLTPGTDLLIYRGPDIRGRTADEPTPDAQCAPDAVQRDFVLVLAVASVRATDLERIPREGSLSTDPRNLPAPGVAPAQAVTRDRILRCVRVARPGLAPVLQDTPAATPASVSTEMECRPLKVVGGRDVIDISGRPVDLLQLLGGGGPLGATAPGGLTTEPSWYASLTWWITFVFTFAALFAIDWVCTQVVWKSFFKDSMTRNVGDTEPLKFIFFVIIAAGGTSSLGAVLNKIFLAL